MWGHYCVFLDMLNIFGSLWVSLGYFGFFGGLLWDMYGSCVKRLTIEKIVFVVYGMYFVCLTIVVQRSIY